MTSSLHLKIIRQTYLFLPHFYLKQLILYSGLSWEKKKILSSLTHSYILFNVYSFQIQAFTYSKYLQKWRKGNRQTKAWTQGDLKKIYFFSFSEGNISVNFDFQFTDLIFSVPPEPNPLSWLVPPHLQLLLSSQLSLAALGTTHRVVPHVPDWNHGCCGCGCWLFCSSLSHGQNFLHGGGGGGGGGCCCCCCHCCCHCYCCCYCGCFPAQRKMMMSCLILYDVDAMK